MPREYEEALAAFEAPKRRQSPLREATGRRRDEAHEVAYEVTHEKRASLSRHERRRARRALFRPIGSESVEWREVRKRALLERKTSGTTS